MITIIAVLVLILSSLPFIRKFMEFRKFTGKMDTIPGPKSYPLIGITYLFFGISRRKMFQKFTEIFNAYPYVLRICIGIIPEVGINKAEYVEKIISTSTHMEKSWTYGYLKEWLGDGLLISSGEKWFQHRKIITTTFHFNILETFCEVFAEKSNIMVKNLEKHCGTNQPFDIYKDITKVTLDIIGEAAMGVKLNAQDAQSNEYLDSVYLISELLMERIMAPWLHLDIIYNLTSNSRVYKKCLRILHTYTENVIKERRQSILLEKNKRPNLDSNAVDVGQKKRLAFLDMLLETDLTDLEIREEVDTFMFEGHDTTTVGIVWTIFLLGLHPEYQEQCFEEINAIFHGDKNTNATLQDLGEMKILERVIKESLRLFPSVPFFGRYMANDVKLDDYTVPKGCTVLIHTYHLHRDERHFPDPEKFDPDRFLPENTVGRHPYAYIPFSAGPRNCVGQRFAMYEEKSVISTLIRNFKFKTIGTRDVDILAELVLKPMDGVNITLERRC